MLEKQTKKQIIFWCFISALVSGVVYFSIMIANGVAPFGDNIILRNDSFFQYVPFLNEFAERIKEGGSLLYSWSSSGGQNFFGTICYYLLNPYNFVALFFSSEKITEAYNLIVLLNAMTISFTMAWFLQKKFKISNFSTVIFALLYTYSGFFIAYYYNTMWLMALICLPIIALGIEKITNGEKAWTYLISLALCIISNFYLGYMICIFSVLYFFVCLFSQDVNKRESEGRIRLSSVLLKYIGGSLCAGGIAAITLIPIIYSLGNAYVKNSWAENISVFFNAFEFMRVHLPGVIPNTMLMTSSTFPPVALGSFALILIPMYAFVKKISTNEKIAHIVLVVIFIISFDIPTIYYIWHGMSAPAGLPYRFAFLYLFTLVILAYKVFTNIKDIKKPVIIIPIALLVTTYIYSFTTVYDNYGVQLIFGAVTSAVSLLLVILFMFVKNNKQTALYVVSLVLVIVETIATTGDVFGSTKGNTLYQSATTSENIQDIISKDTNEFYRMEYAETDKIVLTNRNESSINTGSIYNYNGLSGFSSLMDSDYAMLQFDLGCQGNFGNAFAYTAQTPVYNTLFNVGYVADNGGALSASPYYSLIGTTDDGTAVYKAINSTYFATLANTDVESWDDYTSNPLLTQNSLWKSITGVDGVITMLEPDTTTLDNCSFVSQQDAQAADDDVQYFHIHHDDEENGEEEHEEQSVYDALGELSGYYSYKINSNNFSISFTFTPEKTQNIFLTAQSGIIENATVTKADSDYNNTFNFGEKRIIDIGTCTKGVSVTVTFTPSDAFDITNLDEGSVMDDGLFFLVGAFNDEAYQQGLSELEKNGSFTVESFSETDITAMAKVNEDSTCIVPVPYDKGWTVYIDGEATDLVESSTHLLMFALTAGEHTVEMKYFPQGLREGIFVSVASILALLLALLLEKVSKMKAEFVEEEKKKSNSDNEGKDSQKTDKEE